MEFQIYLVFTVILSWISLEGFCASEYPLLGLRPSTDGRQFDSVPESLIQAENYTLLSGQGNHELATEEMTNHLTYAIPFDKMHFDFDDKDWVVYNLPNSSNEQMIVTSTEDTTKKLKIGTVVKENSNIIVTYQIHLTSGANSVKPKFTVFLVSGKKRELLKEEDASEEGWKTTSLHVRTDAESELFLVGILKAQGNQIALRSFQIQDLASLVHDRYGESLNNFETEDLLTGTEVHGDAFFNEDYDVTGNSNPSEILASPHPENPNLGSERNNTGLNASSIGRPEEVEPENSTAVFLDNSNFMNKPEPTKEGFPDYHDELDYSDHSLQFNDINGTAANSENDIPGSGANNGDNSAITGNVSALNPENGAIVGNQLNSTSSGIEVATSRAKGVFNFFVVVIIIAIAVIGFIWWRRKRRKQEDEIPVFSRAATEHGNPTFSNSESNVDGHNSEPQANYRSFE